MISFNCAKRRYENTRTKWLQKMTASLDSEYIKCSHDLLTVSSHSLDLHILSLSTSLCESPTRTFFPLALHAKLTKTLQ